MNKSCKWKAVAVKLLLLVVITGGVSPDATAQKKRHSRGKKAKTSFVKRKDSGSPFDEAKADPLIDSAIVYTKSGSSSRLMDAYQDCFDMLSDKVKPTSQNERITISSKSREKRTDPVTALQGYFNGLNANGKSQLLEHLSNRTAQLLEENHKNESLILIKLYGLLADKKDEKLPTMLFIKGTICAEQRDTVRLKETILQLEACEPTSQTDNHLTTLRKNLDDARNYVPPLQKMDGHLWVSNGVGFFNIPGISSIKQAPSIMIKSCCDPFGEPSFTIVQETSPLVKKVSFEQGNLATQRLYEISADSIYAAWGSKELKGDLAIMFAPVLRNATTSVAAHVSSEFAQSNKYSFGTQLAVGAVTTLTEHIISALIDELTKPRAKVYCFEAFLKYENDYTLTGKLTCKYAKVDAEGRTQETRMAETPITFSRWDAESGVAFEKRDGKLLSRPAPVTSTESSIIKDAFKAYRETDGNEIKTYEDFTKELTETLGSNFVESLLGRAVDQSQLKSGKDTPRRVYWKKKGTKKKREAWNDDQYKWLVLYNDSVLASNGVKGHLLDMVTPSVGLIMVEIPEKVKKKRKLEYGAYVGKVELIGAANVAGIKEKDIILAVDNVNILTADDFNQVVRSSRPGDWIHCSILRGKQQIEIPIRVTWKN